MDTIIKHIHLEPQTGRAFTVQQDQRIRVIDAEGQQVADLMCYGHQNTDEYLSSFNIFMNTTIGENGAVTVKTPLSRAGDYIEFQARMDLIIAVTACSAVKCNNFRCTSVDIEVLTPREQS